MSTDQDVLDALDFTPSPPPCGMNHPADAAYRIATRCPACEVEVVCLVCKDCALRLEKVTSICYQCHHVADFHDFMTSRDQIEAAS